MKVTMLPATLRKVQARRRRAEIFSRPIPLDIRRELMAILRKSKTCNTEVANILDLLENSWT